MHILITNGGSYPVQGIQALARVFPWKTENSVTAPDRNISGVRKSLSGLLDPVQNRVVSETEPLTQWLETL